MKVSRWTWFWVAFAVVLFTVALVDRIRNPPAKEVAQSTPQDDPAQRVRSFKNAITTLQGSQRVVLDARPGVAGVNIQVSNAWFLMKPYERRQMTQALVNLWQQTGEGSSIVHIYDVTGREIAGTRALGGVWSED